MAQEGMVTTPHYLASQAGVSVLRNGGNAIDAAIAAASTLSVVYPHMAALGGDNYWLIYNAKEKELRGLNASGRAGRRATINFYASNQFSRIPFRGYHAANTVPGTVSGWGEAYRYSKVVLHTEFSWKDLFADAIRYARTGFPISASLAHWLGDSINTTNPELEGLQRFAGFRQTFLKTDGSPYRSGEILQQGDLLSTFLRLIERGPEDFYRGEIARQIVTDLELNDGMLTMDDFAHHHPDWVRPISVPYRDTVAFNLPPNSQGIASLSILNILNQFEVAKIPEGSADYYHLLIEATKKAFCDRDRYWTDPAFLNIPISEMLSPARARAHAERICSPRDLSGTDLKPLDSKGDTVWLGVVDKVGNAVSLIQSIYHDFGSAVVPAGTGVLLHNRGSFFSLEPSHVNRLQPGKRTAHTLNPAMLFKGRAPLLVYGTMGGEGQPQTQAAMVTRMIDHRLSPQDAIEAPRCLYGRTWGAKVNNVRLERRVPQEVAEILRQRGHDVEIVDSYAQAMGHAGAILILPENQLLFGASDPRSDGIALGY